MDEAVEVFRQNANDLQVRILDVVLAFFKKNQSLKGNMSTLSKINKELKKLITPEKFKAPVKEFLRYFDKVERTTLDELAKYNDIDFSKLDLSAERQLAIEEISLGLLNDDMLEQNMRLPLKKILYRHITTGITIDKAETELKSFILTDKDSLGFAEKYVKTIAQETLLRYDGMINQKAAVEFGMDGFRFVGSNIKTTEPQCRQMTEFNGELGKLAINGKYAVEDLPEIVRILKRDFDGVNKNLDPSNYFIYRNHWGCRHQVIPTKLLKRDKEELDKRKGMGV